MAGSFASPTAATIVLMMVRWPPAALKPDGSIFDGVYIEGLAVLVRTASLGCRVESVDIMSQHECDRAGDMNSTDLPAIPTAPKRHTRVLRSLIGPEEAHPAIWE